VAGPRVLVIVINISIHLMAAGFYRESLRIRTPLRHPVACSLFDAEWPRRTSPSGGKIET
jgi:hypothetical protein